MNKELDFELFEKLHQSQLEDYKVFSKPKYFNVFKGVVDKYTDTAHFVYELLQNADDAKATDVEMQLLDDKLIFIHNGSERFTISNPVTEEDDRRRGRLGHINAITSIGFSSKSFETDLKENKIGKFGVGFKAIFQYSQTPHIYDDGFCFKIENYIVPTILTDKSLVQEGKTVFVIPFDRDDIPQRKAYQDIKKKIENLEHPQLFLNNILNITWSINGVNGYIKKNAEKTFEESDGISTILYHLERKDGRNERILLFSRILKLTEDRSKHKISIGYLIDDNGNINTEARPYINCFFPTRERIDTCYIIHAPFLLVDNREQIKKDNDINLEFLYYIGVLSADSLPILRDIQISNKKKLLNDNIFSLINHELSDINEDLEDEKEVDFDKEYDRIFKKENVFLSKSGKYITREQGWWSNADMQKLLSSEQLCEITKSCMENPDDFYDYILCTLNTNSKELMKNYGIDEFSDKQFSNKLSSAFLKKQSNEWLEKFYKYVLEKRLLEKYYVSFYHTSEGAMRKSPVIKNAAGDFVEPFTANDQLQIFFGNQGNVKYAINTDLYNSCKSFHELIDKLGVKTLREIDLIKYDIAQGEYKKSQESANHLLQRVLQEYEICSLQERNELISIVRENMEFWCNEVFYNSGDNNLCWAKCCSIYNNDTYREELYQYFSLAKLRNKCFLCLEYYSDAIYTVSENVWKQFIKDLNLHKSPQVVTYQRALTNNEKYYSGVHRTSGFDIRVYNFLEGFDDVAEHLTECEDIKIMSKYIWNEIRLCIVNHSSLFREDYSDYYYRSSKTYYWKDHLFTNALRLKKWLYLDGELCPIANSKIYKDAISRNGYQTCDELCEILGITETPDIKEREFISTLPDSVKEKAEMGETAQEYGINSPEMLKSELEELKRFRREKEEKERKNIEKTQKTPDKQGSLFESVAKREPSKRFAEDDFKVTRETPSRMSVEKVNSRSKSVGEMLEDFDEKVNLQKEEIEKIGSLQEKVDNTEKYTYGWLKALMDLEVMSCGNTDSEGKKKSVFITFENVYIEKDRTDIVVLKGASRYIPSFLEDSDGISVSFRFFDNTKQQISFVSANVKEDTLVLKADKKQEDPIKQLILKERNICSATVEIDKPIELIKSWQNHINNLPFVEDDSLKQALPSDMKFIFGPPGTGKTTTLAKRIIEMMEGGTEKCKILVLAPTNKACDVLTEKILDLEPETDLWLWRFVATMSDRLEEEEIVYSRQLDISKPDKVCVVSTMARYAFDGFVNGQLKDLDWDYVIIDEASMIPLYQIVAPLFNEKSGEIWIAGDPFQIQPIVNTEKWKDENIYSMVELKDFANPTTTPVQFDVETLMTQYRSIPMIGEVFSQYMYGGKLKHHRSNASQRKLEMGIEEQPLNIVSFPITKDSIFDTKRISKSNIHIYSVLFTVEFIKYIVNNLHKKHESEDIKIGVLSPYSIEIQSIQKLYNQTCEQYTNITVNFGTSHSFQGDECDIVIAVMNPPATGMKLAYDMTFINKPNILNVAVSRAQDYLFILMPEKSYQHFSNLIQLNKLCSLMIKSPHKIYTSDELEKKIFGKMRYIENNTFVTSHQTTNVYSDQSVKYEIRIDNNALDIQINDV